MALVHMSLRFDPTPMRRALLFAAVACCAASAALSQTEPLAQSALEMRIIASVNEMRRSAKLSELKPDPALSQVAREHSAEMMKAGKVTHASALDGRKTPAARYARTFGRAAGKIEELITIVDPAFSEELLALDAHMKLNLSGANYAIAAATDVSMLGVGCAVGKDGRVWITELFAQPAGRAKPAPQPVITTRVPPKTLPASPPNPTPYPQLGTTAKEPSEISLLPSADPPRNPQPGITSMVPPKTSPARPPDPQSPTGPVIYEGALSEELAAELQKPGYFGNARLLNLTCGSMKMEISPTNNDSVTISPVVMEMVFQYKDRVIDTPGVYGYDWGDPVHVRYEWSFLPGRMGDGSNAGFAYITVQEQKSRATEAQGKPLVWKADDVTKGLVEIKATSKVAEPKYRKSEYKVGFSTDFFRGSGGMFVLKPVKALATPPPAPPPPEIKTHDGFLTWYLGFSRILQDSKNRINDARAVAATIALPLENARREQQRLVRAVAEAARARQAGEPTASTEITDRLAEKGRLLSEECQKYLAQLDAASADAKSAQDKVMAEFNRGFDTYAGDDLPMWIRWREHFDLVTASLPFEMAIAAGEDVRLREAVERSDTQTLPAPLRVRLAKAMISRGEFALAINQLRRVLAVEPQNADAKELLARAEIVVMKVSMKKASGALGLARASFNNLLDAAGYADRMLQPADWMPEATPDAIKLLAGGIDWLFTEAWERVTHTAINVMDRGTGRTVGEARALRASEREYVANFLAVPIMMRLREKGFTLEQMSRMDTAALKAAIPLNTVGGVPYTDAQVTRLGIAIRNALTFEDIAAIKNQNMDVEDLKRALDKPYFAPADMVDTWVDEFGAMIVKEAILLALPMAELSAGGATVTEFLGHITRYEKAVQWFGGTETGLRLLKPLKQYQVLQEALIKAGTLSSYGKFAALKGSEMMAMMMAGDYAVNLADKYGGEPAAAVTSALCMMVTDLDLLTKWLEAGRVPAQTALRVMATAIRQGQADVQKMEQGGATLKRLRELSRPGPAGQAIPSADTAIVQRAERLETAFVPNGDLLHDSNLVRAHLAEDISSGASSDAAHVSQQFEKDLITKKTSISVEVQRAEAARQKLAAARPAARVGGPRRVPENQGGYEIPLSPKPGSAWAEAEEAMQNGDYDKAKLLYHKAYYDNHELTESLFNALDTRVGEASKAVRRAISAKQPTSAEFAPGQAEDILRNKWHLKTSLNRSDQPTTSEVFEYSDENGSYILKEVKIRGWINDQGKQEAIEDLYSIIDNNIVTSRLMDALGIPCARVTAVVTKDKNGEIATARFLIRKIAGKDLSKLNSGELYQYANELSEQRPFALMIGDYDRKPPNSMRGDDGYFYYVDPDQAYLRDKRLLDNPAYPKRPKNEEGYWGQDHWYVRSKQLMEELDGKNDKESKAELIKLMHYHIAERCLTANRAQPMVGKIKGMLDPAPENEARILNILTNAYRESRATNYATYTDAEIRKFAEDALKTMRERHRRSPEVLKYLNERNGLPLPKETNPLQLLQFPTPPEPIARAPRVEWRVAA